MANLDALSGALKPLTADPASNSNLAPPPVSEPPPLDVVDAVQPLSAELGGIDSRATRDPGTTGYSFKAGAAALAQPLVAKPASGAAAIEFNGLSPAEQRDKVASMIQNDPAGAAKYAGDLASDESPAGKQAYGDYWKAIDAGTEHGGPLFNHPDKAAAFIKASNDQSGPGADRVRIDSLDHLYVGFLAEPTYRGFAQADLGAVVTDMLSDLTPKHPGEPGLVRAYEAMPLATQKDAAQAMAAKDPAAAARFADDIGAVSKQGLDTFVESASKQSERFRHERLLRDGTPDQRMDVLARYYPDQMLEKVERYKTSDPDKYHRYMEGLATHNPDSFVAEYAKLRTTSPEIAARFEADMMTGKGPAFDALQQSRSSGATDVKRRVVKDLLERAPVQGLGMLKHDPDLAGWLIATEPVKLRGAIDSLVKRHPEQVKEIMSGMVDTFAADYVRLRDAGSPDAPGRARQLGIMVGTVHAAAVDAAKTDPAASKTSVLGVLDAVLSVAALVHPGVATASKIASATKKVVGVVTSVREDIASGRTTVEKSAERTRDALLQAANLGYIRSSGEATATKGWESFRDEVTSGYESGFSGATVGMGHPGDE